MGQGVGTRRPGIGAGWRAATARAGAPPIVPLMFARVLGVLGKGMIAAGVLILLFVAYQLWGTGYRTDLAQTNLRTQFDQQLTRVANNQSPIAGNASSPGGSAPATAPPTTGPSGGLDGATATTATTATTAKPGSAGDDPILKGQPKGPGTSTPGNAGDPNAAQQVDFRYAKGQTVGVIRIPKIGSDFAIIEGVDLPLLTEGPGHFPGTPLPGQPGNAALAGHRVTYKAPFNRIDELAPGDQIQVQTVQGTFTYEVMPQAGGLGHYIIRPDQAEILDDRGDNRITLMACHPKYDLTQRIVVVGKLVGNPAEANVKSSADSPDLSAEGGSNAAVSTSGETAAGTVLLGSDTSARLPAVLFSLAALAVWFLAWLVGRAWKKWPAYLIAAPFFFVLLWFAFDYINRSLPAAY